MSDRPQGSVRTGSRSPKTPADGGAPADGPAQAPGPPALTDTGTHAIPGAQPAPATGAQPVPSPGAQKVPPTGTQAIPTTGTQAIPATGAQRAAGAPSALPPSGPPPSVPPVAVPPSRVGATTGEAPAAGPAQAGAARSRPGRSSGRGPRRARLQLRHIDTWSALKISLVLSIALFFIWMVAVGVLYLVLNALGVFDTLNELFGQLGTEGGEETTSEVLTPGIVFGGAAIIGAINVVLLTALCTVGTFIYNMCSDLVGGLEVTLSERD
jgi:hypothetical protein